MKVTVLLEYLNLCIAALITAMVAMPLHIQVENLINQTKTTELCKKAGVVWKDVSDVNIVSHV